MNRSEVWWAELGRKRRPVVILTRTEVIDVRELLTVAELTTSIRGLAVEVPVGRSRCVRSIGRELRWHLHRATLNAVQPCRKAQRPNHAQRLPIADLRPRLLDQNRTARQPKTAFNPREGHQGVQVDVSAGREGQRAHDFRSSARKPPALKRRCEPCRNGARGGFLRGRPLARPPRSTVGCPFVQHLLQGAIVHLDSTSAYTGRGGPGCQPVLEAS